MASAKGKVAATQAGVLYTQGEVLNTQGEVLNTSWAGACSLISRSPPLIGPARRVAVVLNPKSGAAAGIQHFRDQIADSFAVTPSE